MKAIKKVLGKKINLFEVPANANSIKEIKPLAKYGLSVENAGALCSQYTLKTISFPGQNFSPLDVIDNDVDSVVYALDNGAYVLSLKDTFVKGDTVILHHPNTYKAFNKGYGKVVAIFNTSAEYRKYIRAKGLQAMRPNAFSKNEGIKLRGVPVFLALERTDLKLLKEENI